MIKIRYAFPAVLIEHQTMHLEGVIIGRIICLQGDGYMTVGAYKQWLRVFPIFSLTVTGRWTSFPPSRFNQVSPLKTTFATLKDVSRK